jgi:hypothetical protein
MATEHADTLWAAREQMVTSRRSLAEALTKPYKGGETEGLRSRFVEIQGLIEARAGPGRRRPTGAVPTR